MPNTERRRHPRYGFQGEAEIEWGSATLKAMVSDISQGGMFVVAANPLWVGATFAARLLMEQPIAMDCVVRRVLPGRGMGVEFLNPKQKTAEEVARLVGMLANP